MTSIHIRTPNVAAANNGKKMIIPTIPIYPSSKDPTRVFSMKT